MEPTATTVETAAGVAPATAMAAAAMALCVSRLQRHGEEPRRRQDRHAARDL
jgi:hypothetical protein